MIVSAIADPLIFGPNGVTDELSAREVVKFLDGIVENGLLLCDPTRRMMTQSLIQAQQLANMPGGTKKGQRILLLLQEIAKNHEKFVACCDANWWRLRNPRNDTQTIECLAAYLAPDALVTTAANVRHYLPLVGPNCTVIDVRDVSQSPYEVLRASQRHAVLPFDKLDPADVAERIGRALKYAGFLRFFDPHLVETASSTRKFLEGIRYFTDLWNQWCVVGPPNSRRVELVTLGDRMTRKGHLTGAEAVQRLANHIVIPLASAGNIAVTGTVKKDADPPIFHARFIQARKRTVMIDPGFDAFKANGPIRRCFCTLEPAGSSHVEECQKLPTIK